MSDSGMFGRSARLALFAFAALVLPHAGHAAQKVCTDPLTRAIPDRAANAPTGTAVMQQLMQSSGGERDKAVVRQVLDGNVPTFLRHLVPVSIQGTLAGGQAVLVTICVTPGYVAVGDDADFVRVPMGLAAAAQIADRLGFFLPTTRMVDEIYSQAKIKVAPSPMKPTSQMSSTAYLVEHNRTLEAQRSHKSGGADALTAGEKKDIVLTNRLRSNPGKVAIYGWHLLNGKPIQPLSTVHGASYADYSHGVRLVSRTAYVNGVARPLDEIMRDKDLAGLVSSEGPIGDAGRLLSSLY